MTCRRQRLLYVTPADVDAAMTDVLRHVYLWMCIGLMITATVAWAVLYTPLSLLLTPLFRWPLLFYGLLIGKLILVASLRARVYQMPVNTARTWFLVYAALNGVTLSFLFLIYTASTIALTFFATASLFGAMALIGHTTKINLSKWGGYLLMGLIGLLIGSVLNLFLASSAFDWILTYAGIGLFLALTVYDAQWIKRSVAMALEQGDEAMLGRTGVIGALALYLDFINLFLRLLRLFGRRRR